MATGDNVDKDGEYFVGDNNDYSDHEDDIKDKDKDKDEDKDEDKD